MKVLIGICTLRQTNDIFFFMTLLENTFLSGWKMFTHRTDYNFLECPHTVTSADQNGCIT